MIIKTLTLKTDLFIFCHCFDKIFSNSPPYWVWHEMFNFIQIFVNILNWFSSVALFHAKAFLNGFEVLLAEGVDTKKGNSSSPFLPEHFELVQEAAREYGREQILR